MLSLVSRSLPDASLNGSELMPHPDVEWSSLHLPLSSSLPLSGVLALGSRPALPSLLGPTASLWRTLSPDGLASSASLQPSHLSPLSTYAWLRNQETVLGCCQQCCDVGLLLRFPYFSLFYVYMCFLVEMKISGFMYSL